MGIKMAGGGGGGDQLKHALSGFTTTTGGQR